MALPPPPRYTRPMDHQDNIAQAATLLRQVDTIAPIGARRLWSRALPKAIASMALSIASLAAPTAIGLLASHQALDQGAVSQFAGALHLYPDIKPAAAASIYSAGAIHPLLKAGMDSDGFIDKDRLFAAWSAAGITERTATALVIHLWAAGAIVSSPSGQPEGIAEHRFDAAALAALALPDPSAIVYDPTLPVPSWPEASQKYTDGTHYLGFGDTGIEFASTAGDITPEQAREHLAHAVSLAGFASYSVPLDAMASPQAMYGHADALIQLNDELAAVSGWAGQVAGLGGRVHWVPASQAGVQATARPLDGAVMIKGAAGSYAHEFIHAIDYAIAQHALLGNFKLPLSDDRGLLRLVQDASINDAHHDHIANLRDAMPEFHAHVDDFKASSPLSFMPDEAPLGFTMALTSPSEVIARSFEMHVAAQALKTPGVSFIAMGTLDNQSTAGLYGMHYLYPGDEEALAQSDAWSAWFANLAPLELSKAYEPPPATAEQSTSPGALACALSARRGLVASVPPKGCSGP